MRNNTYDLLCCSVTNPQDFIKYIPVMPKPGGPGGAIFSSWFNPIPTEGDYPHLLLLAPQKNIFIFRHHGFLWEIFWRHYILLCHQFHVKANSNHNLTKIIFKKYSWCGLISIESISYNLANSYGFCSLLLLRRLPNGTSNSALHG